MQIPRTITMIKPNPKHTITILSLLVFVLCQLSLVSCGGESAPDSNELPKATKKSTKKSVEKTDEDEDSEEEEETAEEEEKKSPVKTKEQVDQFLKYAKEIIDDELVLPQEIINSAKTYEEEHVEKKKWRGNYMIVTVNKKGVVTNIKFRTKIPSVEYEDINDAFEAAVYKAQPFRNPPLNKGEKTFEFKVRLLGTKAYVTKYKLKL